MDCSVCKERGAVDSCAICHELLCEVCAAVCETCGKHVCPQHKYTTHKGRVLCAPCQEKRREARHAERHPEEAAGAALAGNEAMAASGDEMEEEERPVLTESVRKPPPPWKLSLYAACAAVALALIVLALPSLRRAALPWGGYIATPYVLLLIPAMSVFWGIAGLLNKEQQDDQPRCYAAIGIAVLSCVLLLAAVFTDPARRAEADELKMENARKQMTPTELKQWREEKLQRFKK